MVAQQNNVGDVACVSCERLQLGDDPEVPGPILRVWKQCCVQNLIIPRQLFRRIAEPAEIFIGQLCRQGEKCLAALACTAEQPLVGIMVKPDLKEQHNGQQQGQYGKEGAAQNASRPEEFMPQRIAQFFPRHLKSPPPLAADALTKNVIW